MKKEETNGKIFRKYIYNNNNNIIILEMGRKYKRINSSLARLRSNMNNNNKIWKKIINNIYIQYVTFFNTRLGSTLNLKSCAAYSYMYKEN